LGASRCCPLIPAFYFCAAGLGILCHNLSMNMHRDWVAILEMDLEWD
jgi:hypothetical protein